jgi:hypothetical protein
VGRKRREREEGEEGGMERRERERRGRGEREREELKLKSVGRALRIQFDNLLTQWCVAATSSSKIRV